MGQDEDVEAAWRKLERAVAREERAAFDVAEGVRELVRLGVSYRSLELVTGISKSRLHRETPRQLSI